MSGSGECLQLDVGNSSAKWRVVAGAEVLARGRYVSDDPESRQQLLAASETLDAIWVASVAGQASEAALADMLRAHFALEPWFARCQAVTGDLRHSYRDPGRMGVDRWLAMLAARERCRGGCCVVDSGSALTIDMVSADGRHEGGYIIPGAGLMERALLLDTDRVRFAEDVGYDLAPGTSTAEAVRHGIALAQVGSLRAALAEQEGAGERELFFCGGGGEALMKLAKLEGTVCPDLVFEGLEVMAALQGR